MFAVWNRVRHFLMWYQFFLVRVVLSEILDVILVVLPVILDVFLNVFDIFRCHYSGFIGFPYDSIRFHAYNI